MIEQKGEQGLGWNEPKEKEVIVESMTAMHLLWFVRIIRFA